METLTAPVSASDNRETNQISFRVQQIRTPDEFYDFCQDNPNYKFEREPDGLITIMPNTGGRTGIRNSELNADVTIWNRQTRLGNVFDSSTAFNLPDGSTRSPDVAWISSARWNALTEREQDRFPPACPDFIIELMSITDSPASAKAKVVDVWMANGCQLAWLIDPKTQTTHVFRANGEIQVVVGFDKPLSGEDVLPGFVLDLRTV